MSETITPAPLDLEAIEARIKTIEPFGLPDIWRAQLYEENEPQSPDGWIVFGLDDSVEAAICTVFGGNQDPEAISKFIAGSRQDIPALIAEIHRLREDNARLTGLYEQQASMVSQLVADKGKESAGGLDALVILRGIEWKGCTDECCPDCRYGRDEFGGKHHADCKLAAAIGAPVIGTPTTPKGPMRDDVLMLDALFQMLPADEVEVEKGAWTRLREALPADPPTGNSPIDDAFISRALAHGFVVGPQGLRMVAAQEAGRPHLHPPAGMVTVSTQTAHAPVPEVEALVDAFSVAMQEWVKAIQNNETSTAVMNLIFAAQKLDRARAAILAAFAHIHGLYEQQAEMVSGLVAKASTADPIGDRGDLVLERDQLRAKVAELEHELEGAVRGRPIPEAARIKLAEAKAYFYHDRKLGTVVKVKDQAEVWRLITVAESFLGDPDQAEGVKGGTPSSQGAAYWENLLVPVRHHMGHGPSCREYSRGGSCQCGSMESFQALAEAVMALTAPDAPEGGAR